jgi:hypothetical protein
MYPSNDFHYGDAPRVLNPWWPQVNFEGQPTVQPQSNPYFGHWPQNLGQTPSTTRYVGYAVIAAIGALALWAMLREQRQIEAEHRKRGWL